jgi:hypothetical protein
VAPKSKHLILASLLEWSIELSTGPRMPATEIHKVYNALEPVIAKLRRVSLKDVDLYLLAVIAAFVKNYEFNQYASGLDSTAHSFYLTPTLRGMVEDIIFLKSIAHLDQPDRSKLIGHIQMSGIMEGFINQEEFFDESRPGQPVPTESNGKTIKMKADTDALQIYAKYGLVSKKGKKLRIIDLARRCHLLPLYHFLYSATSKWVHFNPQILFRMAWGPDRSCTGIYTLSTENFSGHYANFNFIYGTYLFALFFDTFKEELPLASEIEPRIDELKDLLHRFLRWPEIVTYEEMNVDPPSEIIYAMLLAVKEYED